MTNTDYHKKVDTIIGKIAKLCNGASFDQREDLKKRLERLLNNL